MAAPADPQHPLHQYRVTKYDPAFRDVGGAYMKDEWTAPSDIGRCFDDVLLTEEAYLAVESAYLACALSFHAEAGSPELRAEGVECYGEGPHPVEGAIVSREDLATVCRTVLRELSWCRLTGRDFFIHFGYDYYLYIGAGRECRESLALARQLGLFPESCISPYHPEEPDGV